MIFKIDQVDSNFGEDLNLDEVDNGVAVGDQVSHQFQLEPKQVDHFAFISVQQPIFVHEQADCDNNSRNEVRVSILWLKENYKGIEIFVP